jgi:hypothetical protein
MRKLAIESVMDLDLDRGPADVVAAWKRLNAEQQLQVLNKAMKHDLKALGFETRHPGKRAPRRKVRRGIGSY